jgi:hypothetical protein
MWLHKGFYIVFYFKLFCNYKTFLVPQHLQKFTIVHRQIMSVTAEIRHIRVRYNEGLMYMYN